MISVFTPGAQNLIDRYGVLIDIGGTAISLRTEDRDFKALLESRYAGFTNGNAEPALTFDMDLTAPGRYDGLDIQVSCRSDEFWLERGDFSAEWSFQTRHGRIRQSPNPYSIDSILRVVHTIVLARQGGFLLHSASAMRNGKAFLFSGLSGAGKTTISGLAPQDATLLTDEISYIRPVNRAYFAFGTPFAGELGRPGTNTSAPVAGLYFLRKAPDNSMERILPSEAVRLLMRNILFFSRESSMVNSVLQSACDFLADVPAFWLSFFPDQRVWEMLR